MGKRILAIFGFVLFLNLFFFHLQGPVSFGLLSLGFFAFVLGLFFDQSLFKRQWASILGIFAVVLLACFNIISRANLLVVFLSGAAIAFSLILLIYLLSLKLPFVRCLMELILAPLRIGWAYLVSGVRFIGALFSGDLQKQALDERRKQKISGFKSFLVGCLVALPIVFLLISLLSSADPIFSHFVKNFLTEDFVKNLPSRLVLSFFFTFLLSPFILFKVKKRFVSPVSLLERFSWVTEMTVVMGLVALVMASFLIVQWPYVFVSVPFETDLSSFGVATYSEYVNKGFGELLKVALFVFGLAWAGLIVMRNKKKGEKGILPFVQLVVLGEFGIFIVSLFRRIWLYQSYHGWSLARIYGGFLLLWLLGISLTLVLRHFWQKKWVIAEAAFTGLLVVIIGLFNAESFIVTHHPPTVNKRVDFIYLSRMSSDGFQGWQKALEHAEQVLVKNSLGNKSILNKDDRREVAYAGAVVYQLTKNYYWLVRDYGQGEEFKNYLKAILDFQNQANEELILKLEQIKETDQPEEFAGRFGYLMEQALQRREWLKEERERFKQAKTGEPFSSIEFSFGFSMPKFEADDLATFSFYKVWNDQENYKQSEGLDRFLIWNWSKAKAYKKMREEIGYKKLLDLQEEYWQLYEKIAAQSEDQQDYEHDISLKSPFLEPL